MWRRTEKSTEELTVRLHGEIKRHIISYLVPYDLIIAISRTVPTNRRVGSSIPIRRTNEVKWEKKLMHILKRSCEEAHAQALKRDSV